MHLYLAITWFNTVFAGNVCIYIFYIYIHTYINSIEILMRRIYTCLLFTIDRLDRIG